MTANNTQAPVDENDDGLERVTLDRRKFLRVSALSALVVGGIGLDVVSAVPAFAVSLNRGRARDYAYRNVNSYPSGTSRSNDCTGFVSRALHYGGLPYSNGVGGRWSPGNVPWVRAQDFVVFMINKRWATIHSADLRKSKLPDVRVGDVIWYRWNNSADPRNHHMSIVTKVTSSRTYVTQHSVSAKDRRWNYSSTGRPIRSPDVANVLRFRV